MQETVKQFSDCVRRAADNRTALRIRGGGSKDFYGSMLQGEILDTTAYRGIVDYEPTELVLTARAGTPLAEIETALRERGQMLGFEPPHFGSTATLGGAMAAGLSGPRRAACGAARDFVLGVRILDGQGRDLRFGGQVMKNVAGYDVSRLMTGALGTLGLILEISLKVLPLPKIEKTLRLEMNGDAAITTMNQWAGKPLPVSATCFFERGLYVRVSGTESAVRAARKIIGGEEVPDGAALWFVVREHKLPFFENVNPLWRLSVKSTASVLKLPGTQLIEWNGALHWLKSDVDAQTIRAAAAQAGGHATLFRAADKSAGVFQPLTLGLLKVHKKLKQTFDPAGIFNPGRMYVDF